MKRLGLFLVAICAVCIFSINAFAVENFEDWEKYVSSGTAELVASGDTAKLSLSAGDGEDAWASMNKSFEGATGVLASVSIDTSNGEELKMGFQKYIGVKENGNLILAEISLYQYNDERLAFYKIREKSTSGKTVKLLAKGFIGDENSWVSGEKVMLGLALINGDIYFYSSKADCLSKIQPLYALSPVTSGFSDVKIFGSVYGQGGSITGEVSGLTLLQ